MEAISELFSDQNLIHFFFKAFSIVFSILYVLYAIIVQKQTSVMNQTVRSDFGVVISFISFIQIVLAVLLLVMSFTLI